MAKAYCSKNKAKMRQKTCKTKGENAGAATGKKMGKNAAKTCEKKTETQQTHVEEKNESGDMAVKTGRKCGKDWLGPFR